MSRSVSVFVYGTLLVGQSNHHVAAPFVLSVEPGAIRGQLYDVGPYPALALTDDNEQVEGEWLEVLEEALKALDVLEGYFGPGEASNEYDRIWVKDAHGAREGWVYVGTRLEQLPVIPYTSWKKYCLERQRPS